MRKLAVLILVLLAGCLMGLDYETTPSASEQPNLSDAPTVSVNYSAVGEGNWSGPHNWSEAPNSTWLNETSSQPDGETGDNTK